MTWLLTLAILGHWRTMVIDSGRWQPSPAVFADSMGYPVIVFRPAGVWELRWNGSEWVKDSVPYDFNIPNIRLDRKGFLHIRDINLAMVDHHQTEIGWADWVAPVGGAGFTVDSFTLPHFLRDFTHCYRAPDSSWVIETTAVDYGDLRMVAVTDLKDNIHVVSCDENTVFYACWKDSLWRSEIVEDFADTGDFTFGGGIGLYADPFGRPHVYYLLKITAYPNEYFIRTYAWKEDTTYHGPWRREPYPWQITSMVMDTAGIRHAVAADSTGIYHVLRYPGDTAWQTWELIAPVPNAGKRQMAIDRFGYLHLVFTDASDSTLYYATTNPEIGITEFPPEPRPELILIPTHQGFFISGHSGPARIYDPAGRLVLAREIKGKTLISPLMPGVYFVVAGKQRARVAVR